MDLCWLARGWGVGFGKFLFEKVSYDTTYIQNVSLFIFRLRDFKRIDLNYWFNCGTNAGRTKMRFVSVLLGTARAGELNS